MTTTANEKRPKLFKQYAGQTGAVGYTTSVIKSGKHPSGLMISGMPGTGKTTLAHLYVKATLCEERKEGEYEPCGKCESCLSNIEQGGHPNVTYYRITEATAFKEVVADLIAMTKAAPVLTHDNNRADNRRRFIIIDELQNASRQSISPFLDSLEFAAEEVTVVLISMDLDKLDHIVRDAIESRCIELALDRLTEETVSNTLFSEIPDLHPDAADILAYLSRGNMRKAWSLFDYFAAQLPVEEITTGFIAEQKIGGLSKDKCLEILDSLENGTWDDTRALLKQVCDDAEQAVDFFVSMIVDEDLNKNGIELLSACSVWLISDYKIPVYALFRSFQGKNLTGIIEPEVPMPMAPMYVSPPGQPPVTVTPSVATVHASKVKVEQMKNDVAFQLTAITGSTVKVERKKYPMLAFTEWSQFLKHYASDN